MRLVPLAWLVVFAFLALAAPAWAADVEEANALVDELETERKNKDPGAMIMAIEKVPAVYKSIDDKSARGKLLGALGKIAKDKKAAEARPAAVTALVQVEDPKPAWKQISKLMPGPKVEEASDLDLAVVNAAGELAQSRALKPLYELLGKAKDNKLARAAGIALGGYGADKRGRVKVLEELIDTGKRIRPGRSTDKAVSPEATARWREVGPGITKGLNRLTGQDLGTFEEWEAVYKENKKRPSDLFVEDDA